MELFLQQLSGEKELLIVYKLDTQWLFVSTYKDNWVNNKLKKKQIGACISPFMESMITWTYRYPASRSKIF